LPQNWILDAGEKPAEGNHFVMPDLIRHPVSSIGVNRLGGLNRWFSLPQTSFLEREQVRP
jgi:hypothetical protein